MPAAYDALLVVSFGGPEGPDDVLPFLENVLRGRNVPRERMLEVAEHYQHFGGVSPINAQNRALVAALEAEFKTHGPPLPVYWGNRNWRPYLSDTLRAMAADGVRRSLAFVTSAFSSYSGCRQYRENIEQSRREVGPDAPLVDKLRVFFNHPGYVLPVAAGVLECLQRLPESRRGVARIVFTAHSIPLGMASGCRYEVQLRESCSLVAEELARRTGQPPVWQLVYQSRSGPPTQPWLEPDVVDWLRELHAQGCQDAVVVPIGFISDHMEVLYDLDTEARDACQAMGLNMLRAPTVGAHPEFVRMIRELVLERLDERTEKRALGTLGPSHDVCPVDCCPAPVRPTADRPG